MRFPLRSGARAERFFATDYAFFHKRCAVALVARDKPAARKTCDTPAPAPSATRSVTPVVAFAHFVGCNAPARAPAVNWARPPVSSIAKNLHGAKA